MIIIPNNISTDSVSHSVHTCTFSPVRRIYTIQGNPRQINISKILLHTALETAISAFHFFATMSDERRSGILVPHARIVNAMITGGIPNTVANHNPLSTNHLLNIIINKIDIEKVNQYNHGFFSKFGNNLSNTISIQCII